MTSQDPSPATASGILPDHMIARLFESGAITAASPLALDQIQPASLDLRLGEVAYRVRASFLPGPDRPVRTRVDELCLHSFPLADGAVLETGCVYIVPLIERLALPADLVGTANPKSSTGRLDVFVRVIADHAPGFDQIPAGYTGPLYLEISPRTFPVLVRTGSRLAQLRLRRGQAAVAGPDLVALQASDRLVDAAAADIATTGIAVSVALPPGDNVLGWRAKRHTAVIDVDRRDAYDVADFWEPLPARRGGGLILDPDEFYILASKEAVHVPPQVAAEMIPFDPLVGEFRVHYAGFFDPGFGHAPAGGHGARAVLEVRSREVPFILEHGQIVGRLAYERMAALPSRLYGQIATSNYQGQGLKLSKHFRAP